MNHQKRSNGALIGALGLSVAVTAAAAIGLTTATEYAGRRMLPVDPGAQRSDVAATGGVPLPPPSAPNDDPELMRTDRANEHHG